MKKILLAVTAALAITSCSQNEEFENPTQKSEIGFNTAITRATVLNTAGLTKFKVYGYAHEGIFGEAAAATAIVDGTYEKKNDVWGEVDTKKFYWPIKGNVTFFAYSPVGETGTVYTAPATYPGTPTVDYVVNDAIESQSDFVVVQKTGNGVDDKDGISLGFKHALTQIAFKLKGSDKDVNYSVTEVVLKGIKNTGTYSWKEDTWVAKDGTKEYKIEMKDAAATGFKGDATAVELAGNDKVLMLIPQAPTAATTIDVTYTAVKDGITICSGAKTVNVPTDKWEVGQRIVFTLALTPGNEMSITGTLDGNDWTDKDPQPDELK